MSLLERDTVEAVRSALLAAGLEDTIVELDDTAATAADAAKALGVSQGAIVKSLIFEVVGQPILALIAGDKQCNEASLTRIFQREGDVTRPDADRVQELTGFSIGGVAPIGMKGGMAEKLPCVIDVSLKRYISLYAAAGHPNCVFKTDVTALKKLTGGIVSYAVAAAPAPKPGS